MATLSCTVTATATARSIIRELDASGVIAADHHLVSDGVIRLTLSEAEIATLEARGLAVTRGEPLMTRGSRGDVGVVGPILADLQSGFVTGYLDNNEIAARFATLAATFPTLCTLTSLPFPTSGYDGVFAGAAGPASVQLFRVTTTPGTRSKPGFLLIGGTHAREWMNPLVALELAEQLLRNFDPASTDPATMAVTHIVNSGDILIIPVLNPDGLNFSVHDDAGWRKNRRVNGPPACLVPRQRTLAL